MLAIDFGILKNAYGPDSLPRKANTLGDIVSALLPYLFVIAGLLLLIYLIIGGFQLMTSAGDPKSVDSAKGKIMGSIIGFLILFLAFWIARILQVILGLPQVF